jgi:hypothetical protein
MAFPAPIGRRLAAAVAFASLLGAAPGGAQELRLFDAHLHYNQEAMSLYPLDKALEIFRRNGVTGILATSRPNLGTNQLFETKPPGLWVVPLTACAATCRPGRPTRRSSN